MDRGSLNLRKIVAVLALTCVLAMLAVAARSLGRRRHGDGPASGDGPVSRDDRQGDGVPSAVVSEAASVAEIEREIQWLLSCQMADGAIAQTPLGERVVPYFANIAAKTMVGLDPEGVRRYILWYIDHMNSPDHLGLTGTVYDYELGRDGPRPTYWYDSADGYAATFLSLISCYYEATGDAVFVSENLDAIDLAAVVLLKLQDHDGLVAVMPGSTTKYLMDNCESYRGLADWAEILDALGLPDRAAECASAAERIREGIERVLYGPARGTYAYSVSWAGKRFPRQGRWYPDAVSQLDVIACGLLETGDPRAVRIWDEFNDQFPSWQEGVKTDRFPWAKVALTAVAMGDTARAEVFLRWVTEDFARNDRPYPWYVLESAGTVDLCRMLGVRWGSRE